MDAFGDMETKVVPLDLAENQFQIYGKISPNYSHSFLFESLTGPEELSETSVMGFDPGAIVRGYSDRIETTYRDGRTETIPTKNPLSEIKKLFGAPSDESYRYLGGAVGMVNYDAVRLIEDMPGEHPTVPLMEFGMYDDGIMYDNVQKKPFYFYRGTDRFSELKITENNPSVRVSDIREETGSKEYHSMVERAKKYIHAGDIFQVVLSRRFSFDVAGDYLAIYEKLRGTNPSPYMYHLKQGKKTTIGASPEMLVRITGSTVETFPIAGTRRTGNDEAENSKLAYDLLHDEKELAEHTMLVDLGRNDIGRVCRYGTVRVRELMKIKRFSHVQHMVTHVTGTLDKSRDMFDAFAAVFPAGTVTGAPKVRAMEIIGELEGRLRGPYAGAVGYFSYNGCCDFAIAIRSIFINDGRGFVQSGAGIVFDSVAQNEFDETQYKAGAMMQALREASD